MKKIALAFAAALMITSTAIAQEKQKAEGQPRKFDKTEMVKMRTEHMTKQYGLSNKQQKQVQELNEKYADKMRPGFHGRHGHHEPWNDSIKGKRPMPPKEGMQRPADGENPQKFGHKPMKGGPRGKDFGKREETMKAYDTELEKILSADQFKAYKADMEKRRKEGPRQGNGPRQK